MVDFKGSNCLYFALSLFANEASVSNYPSSEYFTDGFHAVKLRQKDLIHLSRFCHRGVYFVRGKVTKTNLDNQSKCNAG